MKKRIWNVLSIVLILSMGMAACTQATPEPTATPKPAPTATPKPAATATPVPPTPVPEVKLVVGQVTDMGGIDDKSFNATAWKGIEDAIADFGVEGKFLESQQQADYAKNIQQFLSEDLDLIVTVGFLLGVDTAIAAKENPDAKFAIVDYAYPDCWEGAVPGKDCGSDVELDNVLGLTFATDEAAFLAGYVAAGVSKTGKIGTFGGIPIPPVTIFMKGAEAGIAYYNQQHGTNVELLGWDTAAQDGLFTGNFESTDDGRRFAESLMDEGADIILPVAGPVGLGSAAACQERGTMLIGVDTDWYVSAPEFKEVYLTSILKNIDVAVYDAVEAVVDGTFKGGVYVGTLANGGVGISSFHDFDSAVSAELKAEVEAAKAALIAGTITVDGVLAGKPAVKDLLDIILEKGVMVGASDPEYPPQSFLNDAGEIDGFDIDVYKEVASRLGVELELVYPAWDLITAGNWGARWDISVGSMTPTVERGKVLWFTDPYYYTPAGFAVHKDSTMTSVDDLAGKVIGLCSECTYEYFMNKDLEIPIAGYEVDYVDWEAGSLTTYGTDLDAVVDLSLGDGVRLDAVMSAIPTLQGAIDEGMPIKLLGDPAFYEPLSFALDKSRGPSEKFLAKLNEILADMHADGTLTALSMKWFGEDITKETPPKPAVGAPLIIGTTDSVTDLDPAETYDFHTWEIFYNVAGGLLTYIPGTTELQPQLAAEWPTVSDDGKEWTFKLRPGMKFTDGTPVDANAVKWSVDRVVRLEGDPNWLVSSFLDEAVVVDDLTITFKLQNPVGFFPYLMADTPWFPVSPNCYSEDGFDSDSTCSGLGPYKIARWERDVEMELVANPDYPLDPPKWPSVIVRYFADATTMRLALENGEIDVAWKTLLPTDYVDLEDNPNVIVIEGPGAYIRYICINATTEPFTDVRIKQALSLAIDREEISDRVYLGTHQPLYSMVPMGMEGHIDAFPERDLDAARALLTEAGYSESSPLEMDLWWTPAHYGDTEADVATVIKANLEETGMIVVSLQSAEWATYTDNFGPGTMPVFLLGWYPDYLDPDNYTWSFAHSEAADDLGIFYASDEMDALLEAAQTETDQAKRTELYEQIQELWTTEVPTIPFTQGALYVVTQKNVTGVTLAPYMQLPYFLLSK